MKDEKDNDKNKIVAESVGDLPVNSRIYINYENNPPTINFDYPDTSTNQITHSSSTYLFAAIATLFMCMFLIVFWNSFINHTFFQHTSIEDFHLNDVRAVRYNFTNMSDIFIEYRWNNKTYDTVYVFDKGGAGMLWYYPTFVSLTATQGTFKILVSASIFYLILIIIFYINVKWISLVFTKTKWGHKNFPEINKRLHGKDYMAEFLPKDFDELGYTRTSDGRWFIELPLFKNMYMDYEADGEFSKYLAKINVVEHPFSRYVKKKGVSLTRIKKAKKKAQNSKEMDIYYDKKVNIYLWKTTFEFKQKPTTGYLRLWFTVWICLLMGMFIVFII